MKVAYPTGEFCLPLDEGGLMCIQYLYLCSLHCLNSAAVVFGALLGVYEIQIQIPLIRMKSFSPTTVLVTVLVLDVSKHFISEMRCLID
jgi:hypothetical protein